jgi:hypothetical protein
MPFFHPGIKYEERIKKDHERKMKLQKPQPAQPDLMDLLDQIDEQQQQESICTPDDILRDLEPKKEEK